MNKKVFLALLIATFTLLLFVSVSAFPTKTLAQENTLEIISHLIPGAFDIAVSGNKAYVVGGPLYVIDISDPENPFISGQLSIPDCTFIAVDVVGTLNYATQAAYFCNPQAGLYVIDVTNPQQPIEIGNESMGRAPGNGVEIDILGNYAYIAHAHAGLKIVDISNPQNPNLVSTFLPVSVQFTDVKVVGNIAYITASNSYLWIVDITNPQNPVTISALWAGAGNALGVDIVGNLAYVALGSQGLRVINVSDPQNPYVIGVYDDPTPNVGNSRDVEVEDNFAFVADSDLGLKVIDVSDPSSLVLVGVINPPQRVQKVAVSDGNIFLTSVTGGTYIVRFGGLVRAPTPFLDLPWNYEGRSFREAALSVRSYFDHQYPLLSGGLGLSEPSGLIPFMGGDSSFDLDYTNHDGYDYGRAARLQPGTSILAAAAGTASFKANCSACGNAILIDHGNYYQTRYYHLMPNDLIVNQAGQSVEVDRGQQIGLVGYSGNVTPRGEDGAHIHFMVVEDKDRDGNFEDDIPWGVTDPFGWFGQEEDPWETFTHDGNTGNKSHYLWIGDIYGFSGLFSRDLLNEVRAEQFTYTFPANTFSQDVRVVERGGPVARTANNLVSIGPTSEISARDLAGRVITSGFNPFTLVVNFAIYDLTPYVIDSIAIYSSNDGINWIREDTSVDLDAGTATAQINHLSYFALMAERADATAPTTTAELSGEMEQEKWFRSDVSVSLNANDNEGGLGVDYTLYKINDEDWQEYSSPFTIINEGDYSIDFYSVDNDENVEDVKTTEFTIDKGNPEVRIQFNPETLLLDVLGLDENGETQQITDDLGNNNFKTKITDQAGNFIEAIFKRNVSGNTISFSFKSVFYNDGEVFSFPYHNFQITYYLNQNNQIDAFIQTWFDGNIGVNVSYKTKLDKSQIVVKKPNEELVKETRSGQVILYLQTNDGNLEYNY